MASSYVIPPHHFMHCGNIFGIADRSNHHLLKKYGQIGPVFFKSSLESLRKKPCHTVSVRRTTKSNVFGKLRVFK